jgi:hypothetical protein
MKTAADKPDGKKGKLVVLLGAVPQRDAPDTLADLGVNGLLAEYGVRVGDQVVLHDPRADRGNELPPYVVVAEPPRDEAARGGNEIARHFAGQGFPFLLARPVQTDTADGRNPRFTSSTLLEVPADRRPFLQSNLRQLDEFYVAQLIRKGELNQRITGQPVPIAVTVSEDESGMPSDPFHASVRDRKVTPRMVVFGNVWWVLNLNMDSRSSRLYSDLFISVLAWLRERPASIGIEPKKSDVYTWNPNTNVLRMILLPGILAIVGIVGLGTGIWVIRRR